MAAGSLSKQRVEELVVALHVTSYVPPVTAAEGLCHRLASLGTYFEVDYWARRVENRSDEIMGEVVRSTPTADKCTISGFLLFSTV